MSGGAGGHTAGGGRARPAVAPVARPGDDIAAIAVLSGRDTWVIVSPGDEGDIEIIVDGGGGGGIAAGRTIAALTITTVASESIGLRAHGGSAAEAVVEG